MSTGWSAYDEGYLQAYGWAGSLAAGASLPVEQPPIALGPGEVAHAHLSPVNVLGYFGEDAQYRRSFLLFGGPVGLAVTGAASLAYNASKKAEAERKATPSWHRLGGADLVMTSQRLALTLKGQIESFWYAETGPCRRPPAPAAYRPCRSSRPGCRCCRSSPHGRRCCTCWCTTCSRAARRESRCLRVCSTGHARRAGWPARSRAGVARAAP